MGDDKPKLKTVYCLRVRMDDESHWGEPEYYRTKRERDRVASMNRVLGGIRTHSFQERKPTEEVERIFG